jgi:hypothetical protein
MEVRTGDIYFQIGSKKSLISRGISFFTKSRITHVGLILMTYLDDYFIVAEAQLGGFLITKKNRLWLYENAELGTVLGDLTKEQRDEFRNLIFKYLGRPYGFINLIQIAIKKIFRVKLKKDESKQLICSEAVQRIYKDMGVTLTKIQDDFVSPADLYKSDKVKLYWKPEDGEPKNNSNK